MSIKSITIRQEGKIIIKIKTCKYGVDFEGYFDGIDITCVMDNNTRIKMPKKDLKWSDLI